MNPYRPRQSAACRDHIISSRVLMFGDVPVHRTKPCVGEVYLGIRDFAFAEIGGLSAAKLSLAF